MKPKHFSSILDGYEKDSNSEGVQQFLISAQKTCPHFNLPSCSGHVDRNRSLIFLYIFIYLFFLYEICYFFMKLEKRKRPRVFEEWVLLTSPKSSVVVCLRAQQQQQRKEKKKKTKKQKCLVFVKSVCVHCSRPYICSIVLQPLSGSSTPHLR